MEKWENTQKWFSSSGKADFWLCEERREDEISIWTTFSLPRKTSVQNSHLILEGTQSLALLHFYSLKWRDLQPH